MVFKQNKRYNRLYEKIGYIFGYFLFTTILYSVLKILNKFPRNWSYLHIMGITILIIFAGTIIKKGLK